MRCIEPRVRAIYVKQNITSARIMNHDQSISCTYRSPASAKSDIWPHKRISERAQSPPLPTILASIHPLCNYSGNNEQEREEGRRARSRAAKRPSVKRADNLHPIQNALFPSGSGKERELTEFLILEIIISRAFVVIPSDGMKRTLRKWN